MRSGTGSDTDLTPAGEAVEHEAGQERGRRRIECGRVSATTRAPAVGGVVGRRQLRLVAVGFIDDTPSTFQLGGRWAAADMAASRSRSSSVKPLMQPARIASRVVPARRARRPRGRPSRRRRRADGTGSPSASLWVGAVEVENPMAPTWHASDTSAGHSAISAWWPPRRRRSPSRARTAEWPTWKPGVDADLPSRRSN